MPFKYRSLEERLHYNSVLDPDTGCWIWIGRKARNGYGVITLYIAGKTVSKYAHRVSYKTHKEEIQKEKEIDHICFNKACINPDHLQQNTKQENLSNRRKYARRRSIGKV